MVAENKAPWRKTPLDDWSTDVDPAILAGDEWVDENDPGAVRAATPANTGDITARSMLGRYMHPEHDVSWHNEDYRDR